MSNTSTRPEQSNGMGPHAGEQSVVALADRAALVRRWSAWPANALERLPWPYTVTVILLTLLALGEQILEYFLEQAAVGGALDWSPLRLAVFPVLVAYILGYQGILKRTALESLAELRPTVLIDDEEYEDRVQDMIAANVRIEFGLLVTSLALVLVLLVVLQSDLLNTNRSLPPSILAAAFIVAMYTLLGWLFLTVVYTSLRYAIGLRALACCPLEINVLDPAGLLPFGRLGLIQSLPLVGLVLVPLILFGPPTGGGFLVIGISTISLLALFVPLWGVREQIDHAQEQALAGICVQLEQIRVMLAQGLDAEIPNLASLSDRTSLMMHVRSVIQETPKWPFRDTAAIARAIVAVISPLVYVVLNELIRTYVFPLLGSGGAP